MRETSKEAAVLLYAPGADRYFEENSINGIVQKAIERN